jgi:hypothetical protein
MQTDNSPPDLGHVPNGLQSHAISVFRVHLLFYLLRK